MADLRIPRVISEFNNYINNSDDYLQDTRDDRVQENYKDLGLSLLQATAWSDKRTFWRDTLYPKYTNPALSTSIVKKNVEDFIKDFRTFGNPLLDIMAVSPKADTEDETQLRFKKKSSYEKPVRHKDPIEEQCYPVIRQLGGDKLKFGCGTATDTKRKSLAPTADGVLVSYTRIDKAEETPVLPADPEDCKKQKAFSTATFVLDTGAGKPGDRLVGFVQWNDSKNPDRTGPESTMFDVTII